MIRSNNPSACFKSSPFAERGPTEFKSSSDVVTLKISTERHRCALIEKDFHCEVKNYASVKLCCSAKVRTAETCSVDTPGNHSRNWSIVAPDSRFSKRAFTGTRVPRKTHAPLNTSWELSTSGQLLQSSMGTWYSSVRYPARPWSRNKLSPST